MEVFSLSPSPEIYFSQGSLGHLPKYILRFGKNILLITGKRSFLGSIYWGELNRQLTQSGIDIHIGIVEGEPSPALVDAYVHTYNNLKIDVVVAIGGGSVLDAGKAISAMLPIGGSVIDYLEGVGTIVHPGVKVPFIAVPTTAGTGSEATKNAVLSTIGENGFKKSLRHTNFVPNVAILDPLLTVHCPPPITAQSGMDAFTQLLESYLSTNSNPITDVLALEGIEKVSKSLLNAYEDGGNIEARGDMLLASTLSGITLANAGLGTVHGLAGSIGGYFAVPHGVICSALMAPANLATVKKLMILDPEHVALKKYATVGRMFSKTDNEDAFQVQFLLDVINKWTHSLKIPKLSAFGISLSDVEKIVASADNKSNPVKLDAEEMKQVLCSAL